MENNSTKRRKGWALFIGVIFIIATTLLIVMFLMQGQTTTIGKTQNSVSPKIINCESNEIVPPVVDTSNAEHSNTKIIASFYESLSSISLSVSLYYSTPDQASKAATINLASYNLSSQNRGIGANVLNLHLSAIDERLNIQLYAESSEITSKTADYIMLNSILENVELTDSAVLQNYESQGFTCSIKDNNSNNNNNNN